MDREFRWRFSHFGGFLFLSLIILFFVSALRWVNFEGSGDLFMLGVFQHDCYQGIGRERFNSNSVVFLV